MRYKKSKGSRYARQSSSKYRTPYRSGGAYGGQDNAYKYYRHHPPTGPEKISYEKLTKDERPERIIKVESLPQIRFPEYHLETSVDKIRNIVRETFEKMQLEQIGKQAEIPVQKDEQIEKPTEEHLQAERLEQTPDILKLTMADLLSLESELDPMKLEIPIDQRKDAERRGLESGYDY